jgi:hypothetical protein
MLGFAVHAGDRFEISWMGLVDGKIRFEFEVPGPRRACGSSVFFHDEEGRLAITSHVVQFAAVPAGDTWVFQYDLDVDTIFTGDMVTEVP